MFTGLIRNQGIVKRITRQGQTLLLVIKTDSTIPALKLGDSLAVNGICLSVNSLESDQLSFDVMPETFQKTTLKALHPGMIVNLEPALAVNERLEGHIVLGHVDGVGRIKKVQRVENAVIAQITLPANLIGQVVTKGSIAIDGISLTVMTANATTFSVGLIPTTQVMTTLGYVRVGQAVNLEIDVLFRYVRAMNGGISNGPK